MFNGKILIAWKANLDIQIVIEPYGCAAYVVGYISKSQRGMSAQLDAAAKEARNGNLNLKKQVRHIGNVFSNSVEVSAQEAVYLALQIPLTKCTRDIVFINTSTPEERVFLLKPKSILDELPADSKDIESDSIIQRYSKRPKALQKLCLADYVSKVDVVYPKGNKLPDRTEAKNDDSGRESESSDETEDSDVEKFDDVNPKSDILYKSKNGAKYKYRTVPRVIRYVKYNRTKDPENYHREQLMLFMPWRNEQKDLLGPFQTYTAHHHSIKASLEQICNEYEHHTEELELARQMMEAEEDSYDKLAPNAEQENREAQEEGVKEAEDFVYFNPERVTEHRHYDIGIEIQCASTVQTEESTGFMMPDEEYLSLLRSLNLRQREFFNHVIHWFRCRDEPLYAFLSGGAGVGKSVVIRALYQCLYRILNLREGENPDDTRILLCAYMGFAAFNINGRTIASAFHKKMFQKNQVLTADELNTFRIKYRHLKVVIIDEISMVGTKTLDFIDTRLQQLTGTRISFGGLSIIAVGDLYQLKPVGDPPLFVDLTEGASALAPNLWKDYFKMYELIDIMRQKDDLDFAHLLNRLRLNELTDHDLQTLHGRFVDQLDNYPKEALHIFAENYFVDKHNENVLNHMVGEKVIIPCHDTVVSANIPQSECIRLINSLPNEFSTNAGNLQKNLTVAVGMIYVMTVNVCVEDGLTNGSTGVVKSIEYKMEGTNRPSVIWVLFEDPRIGKSTRQKYLQRGFYHSHIKKEWTPVFDTERTFMYKYKMYQRIQFPLRAAAAKTVHKAQGATVEQVVVDLSQTQVRRVPHIHYVALSRVKKLENLYILNLNETSITLDERVTLEMQRLRTKAVLELCYTPLYKINPCNTKFAFNNTRSLHKHFQDIQFEPNILAADVVGFAETRLCARDEDMHFSLNRFKLIRFDETAYQSTSRPHHGLAIYIKQNFEIQKVVKHRSHSCEFIMTALHSISKGFYQYVIIYKYPKSSQADLKEDICSHLRPVVDISSKLFIMGDFNIQVNDSNCSFVQFMEKTFGCHQHIKQPTTDAGSTLDLIFSNDQVYSDTVEAYWTDHKLVYCVVEVR